MKSRRGHWIAVVLAASLLLVTVSGCGETPPPRPPPPPTPTLEERRVQTPTDFGYNTRVVDGDIHVWHAPHCRPVPPAEFVASVILTDLRSGSHLYLNRDGSVRSSPPPDYRSDEGRERFAEVLADRSLKEVILNRFECPGRP